MENVVQIKDDVLLIAKEIEDLKGFNTLALDISSECSWTSYFIITTCSSNAHLKGVVDQIREYIHSMGYSISNSHKNYGESGWVLLDCADFVIHVLNEEKRVYYNIEDRWNNAEVIYSSSSKLS